MMSKNSAVQRRRVRSQRGWGAGRHYKRQPGRGQEAAPEGACVSWQERSWQCLPHREILGLHRKLKSHSPQGDNLKVLIIKDLP